MENVSDPRDRLVRDKYFSLRPRPLERWLWEQRVPASAERVFWMHWQEGRRRGDWCSEIPLQRVAGECLIDVSTVTRAYQLLARIGCLRRVDPGRDPANPFHQSIALTEVRVPHQLMVELNRHPNRRPQSLLKPHSSPMSAALEAEPALTAPPLPQPIDPFAGLRGRERVRALSALTQAMSPTEHRHYTESLRTNRASMNFDADSALSPEAQGTLLQLLAVLAVAPAHTSAAAPAPSISVIRGPRKLSVFELARIKRHIEKLSAREAAPELMRQVIWSIEEGALQRFGTAHALHIALKKIREGAWTRPNRMPPNWARALSVTPHLEACGHA